MKELTNAEEQVMQYLWRLDKAYLKDIIALYPEPRPAYTTVSTVVRVLVKKGFIAYKTYGKVHEYYAKVTKESYFKYHFKDIVKGFFNGSVNEFTSFIINAGNLSVNELEQMKQLIDDRINEVK